MTRTARGWRRTHRSDDGAAAVEFALVVIPLVILVLGMMQFAFFFWEYQGMAAAVREGARQAAVGKSCADVRAVTEAQSPGGTATNVDITYSPSTAVGGNVTVSATLAATDFGFVLVPIPRATITQEGVARIEVSPPATNPSCTE